MGRKLRAVDCDPGPVGVGHLDHRGKWHGFAGDIRRACNGDQRNRAFFERGLEPVQGFFQCPAGDNAVIIATLPGEQVGMMLDVQIDDLASLWPASLLARCRLARCRLARCRLARCRLARCRLAPPLPTGSANQWYLRVKITTSSVHTPRNRCNIARADS